jgi:DNA-binding NarL/FixJ family response regulator
LVEQLGILLVELSRLVGEMIERAAARTQDMAVVGRAASLDELHDVAQATDPDVVIVGLHDAELPQACLELLLERPRLKVLGIEEHGGNAQLYELLPEQVEIGEFSPDEVIDTIRAAVLRPTPF